MIDYGRGVQLRRLHGEDAPQIYLWRNDKRIREWCRQYDLLHWGQHQAWLEMQAKDPSVSMYGIEITGTEMLVVVCGLTSIDAINRRAEFSLYIAPEQQGSGYGRKALETLLNHGFRALGLNVIWGETFDGNPAAKMFEKIGFVKEGTRRDFYFRNGRFIDAHLYSIKAEEFLTNGG